MVEVWNLWGGLIYMVAPLKTQDLKGTEVTVQMAALAPYHKSGECVVGGSGRGYLH